jgi:hypothetical protein
VRQFDHSVMAALDTLGPSMGAAIQKHGAAPTIAACAELLAAGMLRPDTRAYILRRLAREAGWRGRLAGAVLEFRWRGRG